jgi:MSHA pilin protein MshC
MSRARGFTLMELVVVLVLAGILAAVAIPHFTGSESNATWYAEQVKAAVRYAQRQAVAQHRSIYVCVQSSSISLGYDSSCSGAVNQSGAMIQIPQQLNAPSGTALSSTNVPFSFDAFGRPSPNTDITLGVGARSIRVTIETGYVHDLP